MITKTFAMRPRILTAAAAATGGAERRVPPLALSERPPIVFDGEIRHWLRIRLAFTRPYFGTASSMSKTFAVITYSGGSRSSAWMLALPALRSFFSLARAVRMSLARLSASILWSSDLSGAAVEVLTGAGMWAASIAAGRGRARGFDPFQLKFT